MSTTGKFRWPRIALSAMWNPTGKCNLIVENEIVPPWKTGRTFRAPKPPKRKTTTGK